MRHDPYRARATVTDLDGSAEVMLRVTTDLKTPASMSTSGGAKRTLGKTLTSDKCLLAFCRSTQSLASAFAPSR
jgi:hypothetical protein